MFQPFQNEGGLQAPTSLDTWPAQSEPYPDFPVTLSFDHLNGGNSVAPPKNPDLVNFIASTRPQLSPATQQGLSSSRMVPRQAPVESPTRDTVAPGLLSPDSGPPAEGTAKSLNTLNPADSEDYKRLLGARQIQRKTSSKSSSKHRAPSRDEKPSSSLQAHRKTSRSPSSSDGEDSASARAKHSHSVVERRYRDNLNGKITQLHHTLQAIEANPRRRSSISQESHPARRVRKSDIMTRAIQYVHSSELEMRHMTDEIRHLRDRVQGLEKLVKCDDCILVKSLRGFFSQVLQPFEYRDAKIRNVRMNLADIFVGTVPAATGPPAAVYASWTTQGLRFCVLGRSPCGNKVAMLKTASGKRERAVPFEEIHVDGGWVGAAGDWIRFRTWQLQPQAARKLL
ncbi:bHLH/Zip transcription factor [Exophiala xenobiotica]|nr:bHLH/Zip transcription factor [Exophiala xenobiotica]KAK5219783.1 bHLH/Zip transcription factor [Exophiala xenobiotica]KAK5260803.1 bHLH/Zip transcription factor [Exophiala xenobiotica]KAK5284726.1 bHLH/Zip transcription factor [Exophiala xenobiotica]KAK5332599.1 bHLH/Zip transcription factor [Exophiala xenobiotica]